MSWTLKSWTPATDENVQIEWTRMCVDTVVMDDACTDSCSHRTDYPKHLSVRKLVVSIAVSSDVA